MPLKITIDTDARSKRWSEGDIRAIKRAIKTTITQEVKKVRREVTVSLVLSTDNHVQTLNKQWRKKDEPTNILSFPTHALNHAKDYPAKMQIPLGDLALAYETCMNEAKEKNIKFVHHLTHLAIHGTLHLLGYDHETDEDHNLMIDAELQAMAELGLANPYKTVENTVNNA
jgi:probable rRNA maturation factor